MSAGYTGYVVPIAVGNMGMESDFSDISEQPGSLLLARNTTVRQGYIERCPGSVRQGTYTTPLQLPASINGFLEFFPDDYQQRIISICGDGNVYKVYPWASSVVIPSSDGLEPTLTLNQNPVVVTGGAEQPGNQRKAFIFSGNNQIQVITGDGTTRRNMHQPAADWVVGNMPSMAMVFAGSLWVWGCPRSPHTVYISNPNDHEDFVTLGSTVFVSVFPGDNDRIVDGFVYKGRPYFTKYPRGLFYIDTTTSTFFPVKIGDSFGASAPLTSVQALDDMFIANSVGSITSLKAVFSLGQTEQGDVLKELRNSAFARQYMTGSNLSQKRAIYYENKKQVMIGSSSLNTSGMNRLYVLDFTTAQPMFYFYDKDNMSSLGLVRDVTGIPKPIYGGSDGYFYDMDSPMRDVNGAAYISEFQTHNMDFKWVFAGVQTNMEERDKHFDYVAITFEPSGNWQITCDAYVDGNKRKSLPFNMNRQTYLDGRFPLDRSSCVGKNTVTQILPLSATGKRLRLRIYTSGIDQNFKISALTVYVRPGGNSNRAG